MVAITKPRRTVQATKVTHQSKSVGSGIAGWLFIMAIVGVAVSLMGAPDSGSAETEVVNGSPASGFGAFSEAVSENCHTRKIIGTCDQLGTSDEAPNLNTAPPAPAGDVFNENPAAE